MGIIELILLILSAVVIPLFGWAILMTHRNTCNVGLMRKDIKSLRDDFKEIKDYFGITPWSPRPVNRENGNERRDL